MLRITKDTNSMSKVPKAKPNMRKFWKPNNNAFLKHKLRFTSCPNISFFMETTAECIEVNDGAKIIKYELNVTKCYNSVWCCEKCGKSTNAHVDKKGATRHKKKFHSNKNESLTDCINEYLYEEVPAFPDDGHFNDLSNGMIKLKFEEGISK